MAKTKTKSAAMKPLLKKKVVKLKSETKKSVSTKTANSPEKKVSALKSKETIKKSSNAPASKKAVTKKVTVKKVDSKPVKKKVTVIKSKSPQNTTNIDSSEKKIRKYKPNKKSRYTKSELKHFRDIILKERKAIFESAKANMDALVDKDSGEYKGDNLTYSSHMAEQGTDEMEREKNYLFVQRDEKYLGYLQDALTRIDQGTYGICVDCREETKNLCKTCPLVAKERLELVPITQHCIECKNLRG